MDLCERVEIKMSPWSSSDSQHDFFVNYSESFATTFPVDTGLSYVLLDLRLFGVNTIIAVNTLLSLSFAWLAF